MSLPIRPGSPAIAPPATPAQQSGSPQGRSDDAQGSSRTFSSDAALSGLSHRPTEIVRNIAQHLPPRSRVALSSGSRLIQAQLTKETEAAVITGRDAPNAGSPVRLRTLSGRISQLPQSLQVEPLTALVAALPDVLLHGQRPARFDFLLGAVANLRVQHREEPLTELTRQIVSLLPPARAARLDALVEATCQLPPRSRGALLGKIAGELCQLPREETSARFDNLLRVVCELPPEHRAVALSAFPSQIHGFAPDQRLPAIDRVIAATGGLPAEHRGAPRAQVQRALDFLQESGELPLEHQGVLLTASREALEGLLTAR